MPALPQVDPDAALDFLGFVEARHEAYTKRQAGLPAPWTNDPIVNSRKFTNVFRILDYGSQFLMRELLDPELSPRDTLMRCFLYRHTGRWEAWELFNLLHGRMPLVEDLDLVFETFTEYRGIRGTKTVKTRWAKEDTVVVDSQRSVFTSAYLVFPQSQVKGTDKLESIVDLTRRLFYPDSPTDVVPRWLATESAMAQFKILRANTGVGDFMASQVLTDWGYSSQCGKDIEEDFDVCGPGAVKGAAVLSPGTRPQEVLRWARDLIHGLPSPPMLSSGRMPSLRDCQNLLCEASKMFRYQAKPTTGVYTPTHPGKQPEPILPNHWS